MLSLFAIITVNFVIGRWLGDRLGDDRVKTLWFIRCFASGYAVGRMAGSGMLP